MPQSGVASPNFPVMRQFWQTSHTLVHNLIFVPRGGGSPMTNMLFIAGLSLLAGCILQRHPRHFLLSESCLRHFSFSEMSTLIFFWFKLPYLQRTTFVRFLPNHCLNLVLFCIFSGILGCLCVPMAPIQYFQKNDSPNSKRAPIRGKFQPPASC